MIETVENCYFCKIPTVSFVVDMPHFRHIDFSTVSSSEVVSKCDRCGLISYRDEEFKEEARVFRTSKYGASRQTSQVIYSDDYADGRTRYELQALSVSQLLSKVNPCILDIGCFDGNLLKEIVKHKPKTKAVGYDINISTSFEEHNDSLILTNQIDKIFNHHYDAVIFSHSIMYISDLEQLVTNVIKYLNPGGLLYIHVPDIEKTPYYSIMGDQKYLFTRDSLSAIFHPGFDIESQYNSWFPREVVFIGRRRARKEIGHFRSNRYFEESIDRLREYRILMLDKNWPTKLCIFGTTVAAAFTHEILGTFTSYFVDESSDKYESGFRGLEVRHPITVGEGDEVLVPPGPWAGALTRKLMDVYGLRALEI